MKWAAFLGALCLATTAALPSQAAETPSPAETAAARLISTVNGDETQRSAFVAEAYSEAALKSEPASARRAFLDKLAADSGGLTVVSLAPNGGRMVEAVVAARKGPRFARIVLFTSRTEPGKISNLFVLPARDPAKAASEAWPQTATPRAKVPKEISWRLERLARDDAFSGVVLVAEGERVIFRRAYGLANQAWRAPNTPDTLFHSGSVSKMLTAAAILKLAEQKRLTLDDTLATLVPSYGDPAATAKITLRHLLTHTSGIGGFDVQGLRAAGTAALVAAMPAPEAEPGARFMYTNAGFILLGAVIEKATGLEFDAALKALVLDPAGMTRTAAWPITAIVPNRATGYLRPQDDPLSVGPRYANDQFLNFKGDGSGGLYTTADDLFAFHRAVVSGRLLGPEMSALFLAPVTDFPGTPRPSKYGLGMRFTSCAGQAVYGHSGGGANSGVSAATFATLDGRWTVIVLANYDTIGEAVAEGICDMVARV